MPPNLGDSFPQYLKEDFADRKLSICAVVKCYCPVAEKEKRMICVGESLDGQRLAFVHINSDVNPNFAPTAAIQALHLPFTLISREEYLEWDSHVNCSELIIRNKADIHALVAAEPKVVIGKVSNADYSLIRTTLKGARTLTPVNKVAFGLAI